MAWHLQVDGLADPLVDIQDAFADPPASPVPAIFPLPKAMKSKIPGESALNFSKSFIAPCITMKPACPPWQAPYLNMCGNQCAGIEIMAIDGPLVFLSFSKDHFPYSLILHCRMHDLLQGG